jgi:hypothetical protein
MTRRILLCAVALGLCSLSSIRADDNVREVQTKLRDGGFYSGEIDGAYSSALAAALTRYQVRNGLSVTGQLDVETSKALGAKSAVAATAQDPEQSAETWRQLRKSRQQSRAKSTAETVTPGGDSQNSPDTAVVKTRSATETTASRDVTQDRTVAEKSSTVEKTTSSEATEDRTATTSIQSRSPTRSVVKTEGRQVAETQSVDSPPSTNVATTQVTEVPRSSARKGSGLPADAANIQVRVPGDGSSVANISTEQVRDYIAAFVLAGLDPHVGSEVEFFADRVSYYGNGIKDRDAIRKDLQGYNARWPHRTFWLPGEIKIEPQSDNRVRVTFPLRYELHNGEKKSSGQVEKDLLLESTGDDFQIVAVNERKAD